MPDTSKDRRNVEGDYSQCQFPATRHQFFKIMVSMYFDELPIPKAFVRKLKKELSDDVLLKGPSGSVWHVSLKKTDGAVIFLNGWKEFLEHHSVCTGYTLIFIYAGCSQFNVQIFDRSACEKEYPFNSYNYGNPCSSRRPCTPENKSDDSVKILDVPDRGKYTAEKENDESLEILDAFEVGSVYLHRTDRKLGGIQSNGKGLKQSFHKNRSNCTKGKTQSEWISLISTDSSSSMPLSGDHVSVEPENQQNDPGDTVSVNLGNQQNQQEEPDNLSSSSDDVVYSKEQGECVMSVDGKGYFRSVQGRRNSIAKEKQDAFLEAKNFVSNNPFFIAVVCPSYLGGQYLYIPSNFTKDHLQRRPPYAFLQFLDEQKWPVKIRYSTKNRASLSWNDFVLKYNINEGDVCIFEFVGRKDMEFKVIIYRNGSVQKPATNKCSISCMPSPEDTLSSGLKNLQSDLDGIPSEHVWSPEKGVIEGGCGRRRRIMMNEEKQKALQEARKFDSSNPFFIIVVKPSYVCKLYNMYIESKIFKDHLKSRPKKVILELSDGQKWSVKIHYTKNAAYFSGGWNLFVLENNLGGGDVCVFELIKGEKFVFKVFIYRVDDKAQKLAKKRQKHA